MAIVDYAYSNTRIRVMRSLFLKNSDLEALARVKNLDDYLTSLQQTYYGKVFSGITDATVREIEGALSTDLTRTVDRVMGMCPPDCVPFLTAVSKKYQFECIKLVLNSKMENLPQDEIMDKFSVFIPGKSMEEFLTKLIHLPVEDVPTLLCERYRGLSELMPESPQLPDMLIALDQYYFFGLRDCLGHLGGEDKKTASRLISMEIDTRNIMIILRSIIHGYDIERFIISGNDSYLKGFDVSSLKGYSRDNLDELIEKFSMTLYGPSLGDAISTYQKTNSLMHFELALKRFIIRENRAMMKKHQFQLGFVIGFLKLKEMEIENLKAICVGVGENLSADEIRDLLIAG